MMKIALVHDFLLKLGGAERVLKILWDIFPDADIFTIFYDEKNVGDIFPADKVKTSYLQKYLPLVFNKHRLFTHLLPRAVEEFNLDDYDIVLSSSSAYAHGVITSTKTKHICYCHSPMRYAWDWTNEYRQENKITGLKKLLYAPLLEYLRRWDQIANDRADLYVANSTNVQKRIQKYYRKDSLVIYPPVDIKRFKVNNRNLDYFLIVSTLTPYKKIDLAVELFNKIGRRLVIIGEGPHKKYLQSIAADKIEFLGFKDDEIVKEYFENCRAVIFPGEEDFGIVPVEAMACGKPVLAFAKGGLRETVVSAKTGEFFFEQTVESMEDGLARLLYNEKFYRPATIRKHAEQYDKSVFIKKIKKIVDNCLLAV